MKRVAALLAIVGLLASTPALVAEVSQQDLILLGLVFRNQSVPYLERPDAHPRVKEIAESAGRGWRGSGVDRTAMYKVLTEGLSIMSFGDWNEGREVAALLDMRLGAKLFEAGDEVEVEVFPVYERSKRFKQHYVASLTLVGPKGEPVAEPGRVHLHQPATKEVALKIPPGAESGTYEVRYSLAPHHGNDQGALLEGSRTLVVIPNLEARLESLVKKQQAVRQRGIGGKSKSHQLASTSLDWHLAVYQKGVAEDVAGAYTDHPILMAELLSQSGLRLERMDFLHELELAEELAAGLLAGEDPLQGRSGDMRLAYLSPVDKELVPFRLFVPQGYDSAQKHPLVMALHGAGGDENAFMDRYSGLFKANAQRRGYLAVTANGRGPYGGYRGKSGQDVIDVLDLLQEIYPVDLKRTYLTGHSMGGGGTILVGFDHAERFAALAPVAGFGAASQLDKAKDMPLLIAQGEKDALVPVERARTFHQAAKEAGLKVKYIEKKGVDHVEIVDLVLDDIFDWFDQHSK